MRLRMIYAEENSAALYAQGSDTCVVLLPGPSGIRSIARC